MKYFEHEWASTFEEAASELKGAKKGSKVVIAGGTDLVGVLKGKLLETYPETVIDLKTIEGGDYIKAEGNDIEIGALTKLVDVVNSDEVKAKAPMLADAARSVATPLIRNVATIGGNICQDVRCWFYRYPHSIGSRMDCMRKGGKECYAILGDNRYHSIYGGMKAHATPCTAECPAGTDIPGYMQKIRENDWDAAAEIIMRVNPMPMLTSRVCPHTCQGACNQCEHGDSVGIHSVERALGDYILAHADKFYPAPATLTGKKVGIVGGGPAGLTAAYFLRKAGHEVTIYEKMEEAGGVMMYGIPEYRLPKHYVRDLVKAIVGMGVVIKNNTEVGKDISLEEIKAASDTVFLDTGAWKQPILGIDGEHLTQFGLNFLVEVKKFMTKQIGKEVLVCGGGNVAMDVALTAARLGAQKVRLVCLEQREEMPASTEEIARAEEEGVEIFNGWGLKRVITAADGSVTGLESMRCTAVRDENGRFNPQYDQNDTRVFESDCIILATGQRVDIDFLGENYKAQLQSPRGLIEVGDEANTKAAGIFAGGDAAHGPSVAIEAIRDGGVAARSMSRYMGFPLVEKHETDDLHFDLDGVNVTTAAVEKDTPVAERSLNVEDSTSLTMEEARAEATRCMNCGCYSVNASDISPVLVALDAELVTTKKTVRARDFFTTKLKATDMLDADELVKAIRFHAPEGYTMAYDKFRVRDAIDFAIVSMASLYKMKDGVIDDVTIVLGGVAPVPKTRPEVEAFLKGKKPSEEVAEAAAELAVKDAVAMSKNSYKIQEVKALIKKLVLSM